MRRVEVTVAPRLIRVFNFPQTASSSPLREHQTKISLNSIKFTLTDMSVKRDARLAACFLPSFAFAVNTYPIVTALDRNSADKKAWHEERTALIRYFLLSGKKQSRCLPSATCGEKGHWTSAPSFTNQRIPGTCPALLMVRQQWPNP